jgi:hypothetical protein
LTVEWSEWAGGAKEETIIFSSGPSGQKGNDVAWNRIAKNVWWRSLAESKELFGVSEGSRYIDNIMRESKDIAKKETWVVAITYDERANMGQIAVAILLDR